MAIALADGAIGWLCCKGVCGERSEEHTSELQSQSNIVCRLLLEKKTASLVKSSRWAHGYQVDPSNTGSGLPRTSLIAMSVTRWATSASRLMRELKPFHPVPFSWPWKMKCVP